MYIVCIRYPAGTTCRMKLVSGSRRARGRNGRSPLRNLATEVMPGFHHRLPTPLSLTTLLSFGTFFNKRPALSPFRLLPSFLLIRPCLQGLQQPPAPKPSKAESRCAWSSRESFKTPSHAALNALAIPSPLHSISSLLPPFDRYATPTIAATAREARNHGGAR